MDIEVRRKDRRSGQYILFTETIPLFRGNDFQEQEDSESEGWEVSVPDWDAFDPQLIELLKQEKKEKDERRKQRSSTDQNPGTGGP